MAGDELTALKQGYEASLRQLRTLLDAQARLRDVAEQQAMDTRRELERLTEALCPALVDDLRRGDPQGLSGMGARTLVNAIIRDVQRRLSRLSAAEVTGQSAGDLYQKATVELSRLRDENASLQAELAEAQKMGQEAELRASVLQQSLADLQKRLEVAPSAPAKDQPPDPVPPDRLPEWVAQWQGEPSHQRDLALLRLLAETGVARRTEIERELARRTDPPAASGSAGRVLRRCAKLDLIQTVEISGQEEEAPARLTRLTERGRTVCRLLLGVEPVPSQATELLARHESPARALLALSAADLLRGAGYEVDLLPGRVELPEGRSFVPDLAVSQNGRAWYVEVERELHSGPQERDRRWRDCYDATGGQLHVVVPDRTTQEAIKSEILFWARQRPLSLRMTWLDEARGRQGEDVWLFERDKRGQPG